MKLSNMTGATLTLLSLLLSAVGGDEASSPCIDKIAELMRLHAYAHTEIKPKPVGHSFVYFTGQRHEQTAMLTYIEKTRALKLSEKYLLTSVFKDEDSPSLDGIILNDKGEHQLNYSLKTTVNPKRLVSKIRTAIAQIRRLYRGNVDTDLAKDEYFLELFGLNTSRPIPTRIIFLLNGEFEADFLVHEFGAALLVDRLKKEKNSNISEIHLVSTSQILFITRLGVQMQPISLAQVTPVGP